MAIYMTKQDRSHVINLNAIEGALIAMEEQMEKHGRPKAWLKGVRMAKTWISKTNDAIKEDISDEDIKKTWKTMQSHQLVLMPDHEARKILENPETIHMTGEVWADLAEAVLEVRCEGCQITDHGSCKYRKALTAAGVPSQESEVPDNQCQYKY